MTRPTLDPFTRLTSQSELSSSIVGQGKSDSTKANNMGLIITLNAPRGVILYLSEANKNEITQKIKTTLKIITSTLK